MYTNIEGKLVESNIITIAPKGLKEYIVNKFDSGVIIRENQVLELSGAVLDMEAEIKEGKFIDDEDIIASAKSIEFELGYDGNILSDIVNAIFFLGDGSSHNKMIALEQIRSALDITWIEILKAKKTRNMGGNSCVNYIQGE